MKNIFTEALDKLITRFKNGDVPNYKSTEVKEELDSLKEIKNKIIYNANNSNAIIITENGDTLEGTINPDDLSYLKTANIGEIAKLLSRYTFQSLSKSLEEIQEESKFEVVSKFFPVFEDSDTFEIRNNNLYFKEISSIEIPPLIVARFVELVESIEQNNIQHKCNKDLLKEYNSLKMFTYWLLLNPIESARKDALSFIEKNNLPMTDNGMLVTFRKVVSTGSKDKNLVEFISSSYFKIKGQKRSPLSYNVYEEDGIYNYSKIDKRITGNRIGNLSELYFNLPSMKENTFTDNHTKTKLIKIGEVYKEDEDKINLDNTVACAAGIHSGSINFSYSSFGDTGVICLVNPMKIRSVPVEDCSKMRSSELFPVAIVNFDDYKEFVETNDIKDLSEIYYNESLNDLEEALRAKNFSSMVCKTEFSPIEIKDIKNITELLKNRSVNIN